MLLNREDKDLDFTVVGDAIAFANIVAKEFPSAGNVVTYEQFGTAMVPIKDYVLEFVGTRQETYESESRNPIVKTGTLLDDLRRRDFTVNALALSLNEKTFGELIDEYDGQKDLEKKILRTPLDPEVTFSDDPLRMMRAVRFASQLQFAIEPSALKAIKKMAERIKIISQERITDELMKILRSPKPSVGLRLLYENGLMEYVFPEVANLGGVEQKKVGAQEYHHKDVFYHTLQVVDNICEWTDDVWLRFSALMHDIAKPRTKKFIEGIGWSFHGHEEIGARMIKKIFRTLKLPMQPMEYVEKLVRLHLRPMALVADGVTDSAVRRLIVESGDDLEDLFMLCRADITSKNPRLVKQYLANYDLVWEKVLAVREKDMLRAFQSPVRGEEIMQVCGIPASRAVGDLKTAIEEAILDGIIPNEHDAALEYLLKIKDEILAAAAK
jgi:putative nucleotidyltransferase with HDIG domain